MYLFYVTLLNQGLAEQHSLNVNPMRSQRHLAY